MSDKNKRRFVAPSLFPLLLRPTTTSNNAAFCVLMPFVCRPRDIFDDRLNSHIAFKLCFIVHITSLRTSFTLTIYNEKERRNEFNFLYHIGISNKLQAKKNMVGENLLLCKGLKRARSERRSRKYAQDKHFLFQFICQFS